jgi:hypothetical protein
MTRNTTIKTLSLLGAALAISLSLADAASAFSIKTSRTVSDGFGDRVTRTRTLSDNGFQRCRSVSQTASDAFGDKRSRSIRVCKSDF